MSIICLLCKDKLLNSAPGSSVGSLNSLVENSVVSTECGHLYHLECLQSWFRTQKKKLHNQGITGNFPDHCPTCQTEVRDDEIRRIHLLEDHRDALEKAKFLEKMENLEIYCHQLEIQVHQLQRENDLLLNKVLSPSTPMGKDDFATIVKNDRVVWLKKDSPPLSGIVLSIFKKDGSLWVKLKLDKKIRTNQRSGLLGSFRFDKKQDWTVPFEEIALEKDFKKNNIIDETSISEPSTPTIILPPKALPSFRSSTMSLPGEYMSRYYLGMDGNRPMSYDYINGYGSTMELSENVAEYVRATSSLAISNADSITSLSTANTPPTPIKVTNNDLTDQADEQRDYVVISPVNKSPQPTSKPNGEVRTLQDTKTKHVTFADDLERKPSHLWKLKGNHFRDHDYKNVIEMAMRRDDVQPAPIDESPYTRHQPIIAIEGVTEARETLGDGAFASEDNFQVSTVDLVGHSTSSTPSTQETELQTDIFIDNFEQSSKNHNDSQGIAGSFNHSCFDTTFTVLFYGCDVFDKAVLFNESTNDQIQQSVQHILKNEFVSPFRDSQKYDEGYSSRLHTAISHLCSSYLDLEELLTILFEYIFKMPPFISYSYDMCDYIHQFFIDFTDKARKPTVQQLFERSLALQDNLKLRGEPSPALLLQMPNSEDGIIHYDAVIPSLSLEIGQLLEKGLDEVKTESLACYCNKVADLECATCARNHGKSPVLFCDDCSVLLEAIHDQMYHKLELVPIKAMDIPTTTLELGAVICLKGDTYSAFMRNVTENEDKTKWVFISDFEDGKPRMEQLPELEDWIEAVSSNTLKMDIESLSPLHQKLLTDCRMFLYLPAQNNSFA